MTRRALLQKTALFSAAAALPLEARASGGNAVPLTLLHTNDMHGHVWHPEQPQGLVRLATWIQQIRAEMPNVVLLDAGDMIHGSPEEVAFHGMPILDSMNALSYDVATAGNHEFDFGQTVLKNALAHAKFPVLSANVVDRATGKPWDQLKPWIVLERGGVRIGVFGITTLETLQFEWPRTLDGIVFTDPYVAAQNAVAALRKEANVDLVIALSHLGYEPDKKLAHAVPDIDLIIGGHSHTTLAKQVWENEVLIAQTGAYGKALGQIDLIVQTGDGAKPGKVLAINGKEGKWWGHEEVVKPTAAPNAPYPSGPLFLATEAMGEESHALAAYKPWHDKLAPTLQETLTTATETLPGANTTDHGESVLGNLFADAIRAQTKSEIAFMAASQMNAAGLTAGPVTVNDLYRVLGSYTRQHLVTARVPGELLGQVLASLTAKAVGTTGQRPVYLSGMTVAKDGTVLVGGSPLVPSRMYTVASAAHVIQDYFYQKPGVTVLFDDAEGPTVRDAAIHYLRGHAPLSRSASDKPRWVASADSTNQ